LDLGRCVRPVVLVLALALALALASCCPLFLSLLHQGCMSVALTLFVSLSLCDLELALLVPSSYRRARVQARLCLRALHLGRLT
jgi:hypothetical protein